MGEGDDQLESGRNGGNKMKDKEKSIWDMMRKDQQPAE
jgi:hypothetical protein